MKVTVCRREHFNSAHRLHNSKWSDRKNQAVFGKCNNANFHGHNYELVVKVSGQPNEESGYVIDMKLLSDIITENILDRFDHKNLNLDVKEFKTLIPTAENIAVVIWNILRDKIDRQLEIKVILYETERNFVEYPSN